MPPFGLYIHIPFCPQHCPYCAFTVVTGHHNLYERYVQAVCREIKSWAHLSTRGPLHTLYLGGGTPSMLAASQLAKMLQTAELIFGMAPEAEITLEANPQTVDADKFAAFRTIGVNRLSLGMQALNDHDLKILGRMHSATEAEDAFTAARRGGFSNVNIDVMFSLPGSTRLRWQQTLATLIRFQPEHVSTYSLTIEEGTRFAQRYHQGNLSTVCEDDDAWAFSHTEAVLGQAGYEHYEVSNFALPGYRSQHNWGYWHGAEYLGMGVAAHSFLQGQRFWNTQDLIGYIECLENDRSPRLDTERLSPISARREQIWLGLRTSQGVSLTVEEYSILHQTVQLQAIIEANFLTLDGY
ncbi:MAG: radical SAM family heme chaperone HemW, partial [bacterium]|nr:radical SAM family heme chaperone HemW [bacterium]